MRKRADGPLALVVISLMQLTGILPPAIGQVGPAQQPQPVSPDQAKPVPLAHLYWHLLVFQDYLDKRAAELESQGKDGSATRNTLQRRLGFSDDDFGPIRASSARLASEVRALDAQAVAIRAAGISSASHDQLKALTAKREAVINAEMAYLRQTLSPPKIHRFEVFLNGLVTPTSVPPPMQPAPAAVQP